MAEEEIKETAAAAEAPAAAEEVKVKKGKKRIDIQGIACVNATFNNGMPKARRSAGVDRPGEAVRPGR